MTPKEQSVQSSPAERLAPGEAPTEQSLAYSEAHAEVFFSVDQFRRALLRRVAIPEDLVEQALKVTHAKLFAKRIKYFSRKGVVTDERVVDDHATQLQAADQIYSLASLYARERDAIQPNNGVAIEFDQARGVLRIVVGETRPAEHAQIQVVPAIVETTPKELVETHTNGDAFIPRRPITLQPAAFDWKVLTDEVVE